MLDSVKPKKDVSPNPEVANALANSELTEAVLMWTGHNTSEFPQRDDDAIRAHYGEPQAARLLQILRLVDDDFYSSDAKDIARDLQEMGRMAKEGFVRRYPDVPVEIMNAFAWSYTWDFK